MSLKFGGVSVTAVHSKSVSRDLGTSQPHLVLRPFFDPATVVTRNSEGEPVSLYKDDSWNFTAQSTDGTTAQWLHFWRLPEGVVDNALTKKIRAQGKALIWAIASEENIRTFSILKVYSRSARDWCTYAYERDVDLFGLLNDVEEVGALCDEFKIGELSATRALIQALWRNRKILIDDNVQSHRIEIVERILAAKAKIPEAKQTPIIPSRIYCSILAGLVAGLDAIERDLDVILDNFRSSAEITKCDFSHVSPKQFSLAREKAFAELGERARGWDGSPGKTWRSFILSKIRNFRVHLMHTVVAFTGMRKCEVKILPLEDVLDTFEHRGQLHYVVKGYTHKLHQGVKQRAEWITCDQGHRAIRLAMRIGQTSLALHGKKSAKGQQALLFPSSSNPFKRMEDSSLLTAQKIIFDSVCPEIAAEDIDELNRLDLARGWGRSGIKVGQRWPLALHQLRRSLSVYAHRSGMVSLPALKAQLQHITDEMRSYYADGWSRAVNLVFDKDHFSHDWQAAKVESTYSGLMEALNVSLEDGDELLGIGAQRVTKIIAERSRKDTLDLIKIGAIAYRETVLGGCVSTEECKVMPLDPIHFECIESNCVNLVIRGKRLDFVIRSQENVVACLERDETGSVEYRLEAEHLKRMLLARVRLKGAST